MGVREINQDVHEKEPAVSQEVVEREIKLFEEQMARLDRGEIDMDDFRRFRLENGIYGIRNYTDKHMVRVKIPYGDMTPRQLEVIAELVEKYTPNKLAHITTRQNIQFHYVERKNVPAVLRALTEAGMTTREACGNTVRNVTACPYAGIASGEPFDVTPYADAVFRFFIRNPLNQNLPRKFKIAFEGCSVDHIRTPIHDIGCVAKIKRIRGKEVKGFAVYVGGGLGATPHSAQLLEEFMPVELLIPTCEALIRIFDRHGNRDRKDRARMKFIVKDWGIEKFRAKVLAERNVVMLTKSGSSDYVIPYDEEIVPANGNGVIEDVKGIILNTQEYETWLSTNTFKQKQKGFYGVHIRLPLGDITPEHLCFLARLSERYGGSRVRLTIFQNILLRFVPEKALTSLYKELSQSPLALPNAQHIADVTRCPGADTCQIAITHSRGLAAELGKLFTNGFGGIPEIQDIQIKISGCFNSCGQHYIATLGFYGASINGEDGKQVPVYKVLVGGQTVEGKATFGRVIGDVPARRTPELVKMLLDTFLKEKQNGENFLSWSNRVGVSYLKELAKPFALIPSYKAEPKMYEDLGDDGKEFKLELGQGECAA